MMMGFFAMPLIRIELSHKTHTATLSLAWNNLPEHLRYQHNRIRFKIALTVYLSQLDAEI
jgi:hypothetical protein